MLGHTEYVEGKTKTYTWIIDNAEYTGYICETCGQMIVVNVTELEGSIYGTYESTSEEVANCRSRFIATERLNLNRTGYPWKAPGPFKKTARTF